MTVICRVVRGRVTWVAVERERGYTIPLTCPACAADVEPVTEGKVIAGTECSAIARCTECRREWHVRVLLQQVPGRLSKEIEHVAAMSRSRQVLGEMTA